MQAFKAARPIEGQIDATLQQLAQAAQQQQPDGEQQGKQAELQQKGQMEQGRMQMEAALQQAKLQQQMQMEQLKNQTKMYIALFRVHSGIEKNHLAALLEKFVKDESNMEFNFRLEYAFFKPTNVFQVKFELDQSRLYMYYLKNKRVFDQIFEQVQAETA